MAPRVIKQEDVNRSFGAATSEVAHIRLPRAGEKIISTRTNEAENVKSNKEMMPPMTTLILHLEC